MPIFKTKSRNSQVYKGKWQVTTKSGEVLGTINVRGSEVVFRANGRYERVKLRPTVHRTGITGGWPAYKTLKLTFAKYNTKQYKYWLPHLQDDGSIHWLGRYYDIYSTWDDPEPEWMREDLDVNKWLVWTRAAKEVVVDAFPETRDTRPCHGIPSTALPRLG